jgi:hypothetical protein
MTAREEALRRLGAPVCAQCDALGAPRARVGGEDTPFDDVTSRDCCSATCAVALLDSMYKGVARIEGKKRSGVIALKRAGQRTGLWPRGRKQLGIEKRKAARVRDVDGNLTDEAIEFVERTLDLSDSAKQDARHGQKEDSSVHTVCCRISNERGGGAGEGPDSLLGRRSRASDHQVVWEVGQDRR